MKLYLAFWKRKKPGLRLLILIRILKIFSGLFVVKNFGIATIPRDMDGSTSRLQETFEAAQKKMDKLDFHFLDLGPTSLSKLRSILREKVETCNIDCYSNCAYDSYFYTHNKGEMLKKVMGRLKPHKRKQDML